VHNTVHHIIIYTEKSQK